MVDVDIDPFGYHESRPEEPTGENIPLTPGGGSTWEPEREHEQKTSFGGESQRTRLVREVFHFDYFKLEDGELYYRGRSMPLTYGGGRLSSFKEIKKILGNGRLHKLGFDPNKVTAEQVVMLNRELPSASDVAKADDIEPQEITESPTKSTEDLIAQFEGQEMLSMCKLFGLDKQLRSIRGSLKVEMAKKVQLEESIKKEKCKLQEI